ncbi:hypothetical protein [Actinophytocola sp.]|uniref:hypothetical protein n=1 Tax=Actinophytocola sp. TaxID=1872138 RepID=UPI002D7FCCC9|nr:hypothetical protein [Actinophytocola sp.]
MQGLAGVAFAVAVLVHALGSDAPAGNLLGETAYFALIGGGVLACGIGLILGKSWARTPTLVVEIVLLGVSWYAIGPSRRPELGLPVAALCVLVLVLLLSARARAWADGEGSSSSDAGPARDR